MDTYEKKLALAKEALDSGSYDKETIEYIFPELKESEDERIKNFISNEIACLRATEITGSNRYEELTNAIAWLEKQGEQKHAIITPKFRIGDTIHKKGESTIYLMKIERITNGGSYLCNNERDFVNIECQDNFELVEQKPAWSEEDEGFFNLLLAIFTNEHPNGIFSTDNISVFKGNCVPSNRIITWLKSLKDRYTWKPSDEQMDALCYVTNFDYGGYKATLVSLYEQLKKLKG